MTRATKRFTVASAALAAVLTILTASPRDAFAGEDFCPAPHDYCADESGCSVCTTKSCIGSVQCPTSKITGAECYVCA